MTDIIYIKGIDPEVKAKLEKMAKNKKMSLNKYIIGVLTDYALNPLVVSQEEKFSNLLKDITGLYQSLLISTREQLAENTLLLREIKEKLGEE